MPKLGDWVRDLLAKQEVTYIDGTVLDYYGEKYRINAFKAEDTIRIAKELLELIRK